MSGYSDYLKERKSKDLKYFLGEDIKMISNKYFKFTHVIDNDSIILITNNIKIIKGNYVLLVDNNKGVYLKDWQVRPVHNFYNSMSAYAVKLNREYFKPYTFKFNFEDMAFEEEQSFDCLLDIAKKQIDAVALGC